MAAGIRFPITSTNTILAGAGQVGLFSVSLYSSSSTRFHLNKSLGHAGHCAVPICIRIESAENTARGNRRSPCTARRNEIFIYGSQILLLLLYNLLCPRGARARAINLMAGAHREISSIVCPISARAPPLFAFTKRTHTQESDSIRRGECPIDGLNPWFGSQWFFSLNNVESVHTCKKLAVFFSE